jgi:hypothetical protein
MKQNSEPSQWGRIDQDTRVPEGMRVRHATHLQGGPWPWKSWRRALAGRSLLIFKLCIVFKAKYKILYQITSPWTVSPMVVVNC